MGANFTNAITNALHASFLFVYFFLAFLHWKKGDSRYSGLTVSLFFTLFFLKVLGTWAHYSFDKLYIDNIWLAIGLGVIFLTHCTTYSLALSSRICASMLVLNLLASYFYITSHFMFIDLAVYILVLYSVAAFYTYKMTRMGFILTAISNIIWVVLHLLMTQKFGSPVPGAVSYDNDLYHILLIISTFFLYKSISRGDWPNPNKFPRI